MSSDICKMGQPTLQVGRKPLGKSDHCGWQG